MPPRPKSDTTVTTPAVKAQAKKAAAPAAVQKAAPAAVKATAAKSVETKAPAPTAAPAKTAPAKVAAAAVPVKAAAAKKASPPRPRVTSAYMTDTKFIEAQKAMLLSERATYLEQAHSLQAEAEALVLEMEPGDIQFDDESGEGGTVTVDRERDLALSAQALAAVEEIDDALTKLQRGTYGICEGCGELIAKARLEALPYAKLCIACKSGGLSRR
jgi:RNA polymerase-binding transcription factor DksA